MTISRASVPRRADSSVIDDLVAATPETRDRTVDFLRAVSIVVVVLWHWVFSITQWNSSGALTMPNPIDTVPGLWLVTWVLQIMPLFFFVGGFANSTAWSATIRRGDDAGVFLRSRMARLLRPIVVMAGAWVVADTLLSFLVPSYSSVLVWGRVVFVPLWFLGVYAGVVLVVPITRRWHDAAPRLALALMAIAIAAVDLVRFAGGIELIGFVNVVLVFGFVHQLGYFYADGSLTRCSRRTQWTLAGGGLVALVLLTGVGPYSDSMVAVRGSAVSNMFPPTACIAALGVFQAGLALLARPALNRWLARKGPWKVVVAANSVAMTVFTWHMTAYVIALGIVEGLGGRLLSEPTAHWWTERPLWLVAPGMVLAGLVVIFARVETRAALRSSGPARSQVTQ